MYSMSHEKEFLSHRPNGWPVATDRALGSGSKTWRSSGEVRASRDRQRHSLPHSEWMCVAGLAPRFAALSHRVPLLPPVARGRHLGAASHQASRAGATTGRQDTQTVDRGARQPERQDDRARRAARLRRGEKKSSAASGIWSLTPWGFSGPWSLPRRMSKTVMAGDWRFGPSASKSNSPKSSGLTKRIDRWLAGPGSNGYGSSTSSLDHAAALRSNPNDGSLSGPSVGSIVHVAWRNPTNEHRKVTTPLCKSLSFT